MSTRAYAPRCSAWDGDHLTFRRDGTTWYRDRLRVGRTARAELTGDAFTFVSPEEESDLRAIERTIGKRLPRVTVPGFDYSKPPAERFETPLAERIAAIRTRKAQERTRAKEKAARRATQGASATFRPQAARPKSEERHSAPRWGRRG